MVKEKGVAINETNKRNKKLNNNLLVCRSSCSRLIARIILSKSPAGGSIGLKYKKGFSKSFGIVSAFICVVIRVDSILLLNTKKAPLLVRFKLKIGSFF
jgi:hypothetical protein